MPEGVPWTESAESPGTEIDLETVQAWCEREESTIRMQFPPDGELPPEHERQLERYDPSTMRGALRRWAYLKYLFFELGDQASTAPTQEESEEAARKLLQREPVEVELAERTAHVTGRSYAAMHAMARHESRIEELKEDLERISELREETRDDRPRFQRLGRIQRLALQELQLHRQALYAHAFTEDGAPADSIEDAPDWWNEISPAEDALLLLALFEAGPGRLQQLGPAEDQDGPEKKSDDWGYKSLLASLERQTRSEPASYFNRDLGQLIAWVRGGAPPQPEGLES